MKIQSTANIHQENIKCLIYGDSGIGKTTLAKTLGEKVLIISAESGLASLSETKIDYVDINIGEDGKPLKAKERLMKLFNIYEELLKPEMQSKYSCIFIDSLSEISDNLVEHMAEEYQSSKDTFKMWGEYTKKMINIIRKFRDLPHYNVIFTCLEDNMQDESKKISFFPSIAGSKAKSVIKPIFDELFRYCMVEGERKLITNSTDISMAKDRSGKLNVVENPDLGSIFKRIKGEKKK